jgi:predicted nucleic-acid-binding Zn-ribbon protein
MIDWMQLTDDDVTAINRITKKAVEIMQHTMRPQFSDLEMDLQAAHLAEALDLGKLQDFSTADFCHDIRGIVANINRENGELLNCFVPRSARKTIETVKGNAPECPKCGNWNAMLDGALATDDYRRFFECRDCGFKLFKDEVILKIKEADEPGMGADTTYTEIKRIRGEKF